MNNLLYNEDKKIIVSGTDTNTIKNVIASEFSPVSISGLVGWYLPENWTGTQWTDASGAGNNATSIEGTIDYSGTHDGTSVGAQYTFPVLYGAATAEINFP